MIKELIILGSTGAVGSKAVDIAISRPDLFYIKTLIAGENVNKVAEQALLCKPKEIVMHKGIDKLRTLIGDSHNIRLLEGSEEMLKVISSNHYDICVSCITGIAGLIPTMKAIKHSDIMAIANKESIICAGSLMFDLAKKYNCKIIPIDSEHNAIFQLLNNSNNTSNISHITITCSGGPLLRSDNLYNASIDEVTKHPNWAMGNKISVDCANMINKGFELIEAAYLFNIDINRIKVIIHPESIVHAIINYQDGTNMMCCSIPDMSISIAYSLYFPNRIKSSNKDLELKNLTFLQMNHERFPLVSVAIEAFKKGQEYVIALNAINEVANKAFLDNRIRFGDINQIILNELDKDYSKHSISTVSDILKLHNCITNEVNNKYSFYA